MYMPPPKRASFANPLGVLSSAPKPPTHPTCADCGDKLVCKTCATGLRLYTAQVQSSTRKLLLIRLRNSRGRAPHDADPRDVRMLRPATDHGECFLREGSL